MEGWTFTADPDSQGQLITFYCDRISHPKGRVARVESYCRGYRDGVLVDRWAPRPRPRERFSDGRVRSTASHRELRDTRPGDFSTIVGRARDSIRCPDCSLSVVVSGKGKLLLAFLDEIAAHPAMPPRGVALVPLAHLVARISSRIE